MSSFFSDEFIPWLKNVSARLIQQISGAVNFAVENAKPRYSYTVVGNYYFEEKKRNCNFI